MGRVQCSDASTAGEVQSSRYADSTQSCNLHDVLTDAKYPLQVRISENKDQIVFLGKPEDRSLHTIIGNIHVDRVKCLGNNDQYVYLPLDIPKPVLFTQIDKNVDLTSVLDVIKYNAKQRLSWLVVTKRFDYKSYIYEAGDILEIEKLTLRKRIVHMLLKRRWKDQLYIVSHPSRFKSRLPSYLQGNFKKCRSPYSSCYGLLSDLVTCKETPFLISLPKEVTDSMKGNLSITGQRLIALEQVSHNIIFMTDDNNDIIVQAIPTNIEITVEVKNYSANCDESINFFKYKERLISNLSRLECCPVYMKDLFPEICRNEEELNLNVEVNTRSHNIVVSVKSDSWCEIGKRKPLRRSLNKRASNGSNCKLKADLSTEIENSRTNDNMQNSDFYCSSRESPPLCQSSPKETSEGDYLQPMHDTDSSICTIYTAVDELENKDASLNRVRVGRDGYVIVPPFNGDNTYNGDDSIELEECSVINDTSPTIGSKILQREDRLMKTKQFLLHEAKFGSPQLENKPSTCIDFRPIPNPRPNLSRKPERIKPVPLPRNNSKIKKMDGECAPSNLT